MYRHASVSQRCTGGIARDREGLASSDFKRRISNGTESLRCAASPSSAREINPDEHPHRHRMTCLTRYGTATGSILLGGNVNLLASDGSTLLADTSETNVKRCMG
jgi:hypothetical protein